ncbi:hypothetical protein SAMN05216553_115143 [Lentzea fradiae]|uniref:ABC-2 type transport system permease protein n=1 Tax=Lentzea fradiae TaxID=200378 RepID=A0A1G7ZEJ8_9PSEU|nr:hypothetical protein [Lentzea fradiae]SDH07203.1 hypothetical protein SAMN05216553_115143 [Lentzea fradiae]
MKIFRHLTTSLVVVCAVIAAVVFVFSLVVVFVVSAFRDIEISAWNLVATQIARWFLLFIGVYVIHNVLPIAVAHGRTRREFLVASSGFVVVLAAVMAVLAWLGFLVEGGIYSLMDWGSDAHGTLPQYFLMFLVWTTAGMFCAASFDRYGPAGIFSVPVAFVLVFAPSMWVPGSGEIPFVPDVVTVADFSWHLLSVAAFVIASLGTWAVARHMPVHVRTS